ncbi:hypothetical protein NHQ30_003295 [Ciborinia camelliae]|nr:hypothetical protein NHQ30_003295 [Ciborinia camelliae]
MVGNDDNNRDLHLSTKKKLKLQGKSRNAVDELHTYCRRLKCNDPIYINENGKTTLFISGCYIFSKSPEFTPRTKVNSLDEAKQDVAKQALRWIEHNPTPSFYWKTPGVEDTLTDYIAELAEGVYENRPSSQEVRSVMIHLETEAMVKLHTRLDKKGIPRSSCVTTEYMQALEVCRLSRIIEPKVARRPVSEVEALPMVVSAPAITCMNPQSTAMGAIDTPLVQEKKSTDEILHKGRQEASMRAQRALAIDTFHSNVQRIYDRAMDPDFYDELQILNAILAQEGTQFLRRLQTLSKGYGRKKLAFLQFVLDSFSDDLIEDYSRGYRLGERSWTAKDLTRFSQLKQKDLLGIFESVVSSLGYDAAGHLNLFLNWHKNGMFKTVTNISSRVGNKTQHYFEKLLELESVGLFDLMDEVTSLSGGNPATLLSGYFYCRKDHTSQRMLKVEEKRPGTISQILENGLRYDQLNIFREINTLIESSSENRVTTNFFRFLARSKINGALGYLCHIDDLASPSGNPANFLKVSLQLYHCGVHTWALNNSGIIGNDLLFFQKLFLIVEMIINGQASPAVLQAITEIQRLAPALLGNCGINSNPPFHQMTAAASQAPDMSLPPVPGPPQPVIEGVSELSLPGFQIPAAMQKPLPAGASGRSTHRNMGKSSSSLSAIPGKKAPKSGFKTRARK